MSLHDKPLDHLTPDDVLALRELETREGLRIEYKECLPGTTDSEKKEFLADVSSFANAAGGNLLYGVREKRDAEGQSTGIPDEFPGLGETNLDAVHQRLESIIQAGLAPRVLGLKFHSVPVLSDSSLLIIRVPRSWSGPHMICYQDWCRFYSRNSSGKYLLDVDELRRAFLRTEASSQYVRSWQAQRLANIVAGETPVALPEGPKIVLHVVPVAAVDRSTAVDISPVVQNPGMLPPTYSGGWNNRLNLDGIVTFAGPNSDNGLCINYTQLFRNGAIEAVTTSHLNAGTHQVFPIYEERLIEALRAYLELGEQLGVAPPVALMVSLVGVKGYRMGLPPDYSQAMFGGIDREMVVGSEVVIDSMSADPIQVLRPCFDLIWNACGYARSANYTANGQWKGIG
jgi:hypothetical protein